ncbi:hypothetical protein CHU98_g1381 [Xylaria longipes]|nr:hypothetical protein CHU98_g1381 [Xylaria longipes]
MSSIVRDTPLGQLVRFVTRNRVPRYPEESADFQLPDEWLRVVNSSKTEYPSSSISSSAASTLYISDDKIQVEKGDEISPLDGITSTRAENAPVTLSHENPAVRRDVEQATEKIGIRQTTRRTRGIGRICVRPSLHSSFASSAYIVVYISSAIFATSVPGFAKEFGVVGGAEASLGLALFVLGYGIGPSL